MRGGSFERLDGTPAIPYLAISRIHQDNTGRIWFGGSTPAVLQNGTLTQLPSEGDGLLVVQQLRDGSLIGLTRVGPRRLEQTGTASAEFDRSPLRGPVNALLEDRNGDLWTGSASQGLLVRTTSGVSRFLAPLSLPDNTVLSLFEDREGNIWAGTQDGIARFSRTLVDTVGVSDGLNDEEVTMVFEDHDRVLWLATGTGDLYRRVNGRLLPFRLPDTLGKPVVRTMFQDRRGAYWFGTLRSGVIRLSGTTSTVFTTKEGLRQNSIRAFFEDPAGNLWIGTGSGISKWDGLRFHNYYIEDGLAYGSIRAMVADRSGTLWIGTDGGLSLVRNGKFQREPWMGQLGSERIWAIHCDRAGVLWLGTRGRGLFRVQNGAFTNFTTRDGLPSNTIHQILEDSSGRMWMSGSTGVFSAAREELNAFAERRTSMIAVVHYSTADGLPSSQMSGGVQPSGWLTSQGEIWFPSVKGAVRIDPSKSRETRAPPVLIEEVVADGTSLDPSLPVTIAPGPGKLEIHYTAIALLAPDRLSFRYKLEGFDDTWTATTRRVAYYTGLPPARYRFRVIANDSAAPAQSAEASLPFEWLPHFYQTGWFLAACAAAALGCGGIVFLIYARQTKARFALLLAERTRLAREMHDTVIQNCVGLSTLLEAAASTVSDSPSTTSALLDRARAHVKLTLDEARQSVWDLRQASLGSGLVSSLTEYTAQLSREKNVPIQTEISGTPVALEEKVDRNLLLVAREAVRNAVIHARPKQVSIRLTFDPRQVKLEVTDDGRGFLPPAELAPDTGCYGLLGMRERIEQLGGTFFLRSEPGLGTRIVADLPLASSHRS
jgi:signal transduction histidine kinase/ligand-binding sensor domain-containing protein